MSETTMLRITETTAEVLGPQGWEPADWVPLPGGNFLVVNDESRMVSLIQGVGIGVLISLVTLGVVAAAVS